MYPRLERLKSTTASSLTYLYYKDKDSDSTASTRAPRHSYNLRSQQRRLSQELSSLTSSSTNSRLVRQQAQPRSETPSLASSHPTIPSSLSLQLQVTFESALFIPEDIQTISDSAANFSRVYSPSSIRSDTSIQLPEYFPEDFSRPPTPNLHEYPIRVNSKIIRTLTEDPRYTILPARFKIIVPFQFKENKENYEDYKKTN